MRIAKAAIDREVDGYQGAKLIAPPPARTTQLPVKVASKRVVADRAVRFELVSRGPTSLPAWHPGAHIDVITPSGLIRQYSLAGDPDDRSRYTLIVRDLPHARGARELIDEVPEGSNLTIRGPRNLMPFAHPALRTDGIERVLFIAAGIGITPIASMVRAAHRTAADWQLVYIGAGRTSMPLADELHALAKDRVHIVTTDAGRPDLDRLLRDHSDSVTAIYVCGPESLLDDVGVLAEAQRVPALHTERFRPPSRPSGTEFELTLARQDTTITVDPSRSALDAVHDVLPSAPYSCRQGFCGTCRVRVLEGTVARRANAAYLNAEDTMLLCSDVATGAVVIDL